MFFGIISFLFIPADDDIEITPVYFAYLHKNKCKY